METKVTYDSTLKEFFSYSLYYQLDRMKKDDHIGLRMKTFNFSRKLGSGAWSTVYECFDEKTRGPVACTYWLMQAR
jgi:hypothetical protein